MNNETETCHMNSETGGVRQTETYSVARFMNSETETCNVARLLNSETGIMKQTGTYTVGPSREHFTVNPTFACVWLMNVLASLSCDLYR